MAVTTRAWGWGKSVLVFFGIIILVIILAAIALATQPLPTDPFTADGSNLGDFQLGTSWYNIFQIVFGNEIDKNWVTTTSIIQFLFLPLAAIWLLMYGIFEEVGFLRRLTWFTPVLAIIAALIVSSSGILVRMMRGYLMMAGGMGIVFFGFILFLGLLLWFVGRLSGFGIKLGKVGEAGRSQVLKMQIERELAIVEEYARNLPPTDPRGVQIMSKVTEARQEIVKGNLTRAEQYSRRASNLCI